MASSIINNVKITGISAAVPKNTINNYSKYEKESHKVIDAIGVSERREVSKGQTTSDLCYHAAEKLIQQSNIKKEQIGHLIFLTQTPDYLIPTTACVLQNKLGLPETSTAFDINLGCSGYVYGLWVAYSLINSCKNDEYVLLLVGDTYSLTINQDDPKTKYLFGDAGAATLIRGCKTSNDTSFLLGTEGRNYDKLIVPGLGFRNISERGLDNNKKQAADSPLLYMDGTAVYTFTMRIVPSAVNNILSLSNKNKDDIDYFVFHQANKMMLNHFTKKIGLPADKVPTCLKSYGNTTSASIPLTIVSNEKLRNDARSNECKMLLCGFGTGLSWGASIVTTNKLCIPKLIEV